MAASALTIPAGDVLTAWGVVLDPAEVATGRTELNINSDTITVDQAGIDWGDAAIQEFLADQEVGSSPVDYRLPNRTVTITLSVGTGDETTYLAAKAALQQKVALFQREGGWLKRDTGIPLFADVVNATLTFPDHWGPTGFMENDVKLVLECLPDFYGAEVTLDLISGTGFIASVLKQTGAQAVIHGDHPGRCRIVVTNLGGNQQRGMLTAFRSRHYNASHIGALAFEAEDTTAWTDGFISTVAGASGGQAVVSALLTPSWATILTNQFAGRLSGMVHEGSYRVWVRALGNGVAPQMRLTWGIGNIGATVTNDVVTFPSLGAFYMFDLGTISLDKPPVGTYHWSAYIDGAGVSGDTISFDQVFFVPLDEYSARHTSSTGIAVVDTFSATEVRTEGSFGFVGDTPGQLIPVGDLPRIPPSGLEGRPVELFVRTGAGDLGTLADTSLAPILAQVIYRPSYLFPA